MMKIMSAVAELTQPYTIHSFRALGATTHYHEGGTYSRNNRPSFCWSSHAVWAQMRWAEGDVFTHNIRNSNPKWNYCWTPEVYNATATSLQPIKLPACYIQPSIDQPVCKTATTPLQSAFQTAAKFRRLFLWRMQHIQHHSSHSQQLKLIICKEYTLLLICLLTFSVLTCSLIHVVLIWMNTFTMVTG